MTSLEECMCIAVTWAPSIQGNLILFVLELKQSLEFGNQERNRTNFSKTELYKLIHLAKVCISSKNLLNLTHLQLEGKTEAAISYNNYYNTELSHIKVSILFDPQYSYPYALKYDLKAGDSRAIVERPFPVIVEDWTMASKILRIYNFIGGKIDEICSNTAHYGNGVDDAVVV